MLDAQLVLPYLEQAFEKGQMQGAWAPLSALAGDHRVQTAMEYLADWNFSTPTGITEGFDPGDDPDNLTPPSEQEISNSVSATIFSLWRGQAIRNVLDSTLRQVGLGEFLPSGALAYEALARFLKEFPQRQGVGASGLNFFSVSGAPDPGAARDYLLLTSLQDALDLLASDEFGPAFGNSKQLADYRWGLLHRIVFEHPLGSPFDIPGAGGFAHIGPQLPGIAKAGGYEVIDRTVARRLDAGPRAAGLNEFMFDAGPARRFVGSLGPGSIHAEEIIPGGQSGDVTSAHYTDQLGRWLTNRYHPLN